MKPLTNQEISRQIELVPPDILDEPITVVGAGAIGSWTILALAKMGFKNMQVVDFDEVDIVNMSSQFFGFEDIGKPKVKALANRILSMTNILIKANQERYEGGTKFNGIVIPAVDSMEVRRLIFEKHKLNTATRCIIDPRMGSETALLYTIDPSNKTDMDFYEKTLYTDEEALQERCTAKSTTYCALVLSGLVAKTVRDVLVKQSYLRNLNLSLKGNDWLAFPSKGDTN